MSSILIGVAVLVAMAAVGLGALYARRREEATVLDHAFACYKDIADETGLALVRTHAGWPRLVGDVDGLRVEIDAENAFSAGLDALLGLRAVFPSDTRVPDGVLWPGQGPLEVVVGLGEPTSLGDGDAGLFALYTESEPAAREWWRDQELQEALLSLPGAAIVLRDGHLTVCFDRLDPESVETALKIPERIRAATRTLH